MSNLQQQGFKMRVGLLAVLLCLQREMAVNSLQGPMATAQNLGYSPPKDRNINSIKKVEQLSELTK
jgi:hypothetical protein